MLIPYTIYGVLCAFLLFSSGMNIAVHSHVNNYMLEAFIMSNFSILSKCFDIVILCALYIMIHNC